MSNPQWIHGDGQAANPSSSRRGGTSTSIPPGSTDSGISLAGGVAMVVCGFIVLGMGLLYVRWIFQWLNDLVSRSEPQPPPHLGPKSIEALPTFAYHDGAPLMASAAASAAAECSICLCAMVEGDVMKRLPGCDHVFHRDCIDVWLRSRSTCPICRDDLLKPEEGGASTAATTPPLATQFGLIPL